ncbi:MAG: hypothetical protein ACREMJ_11725 [Gemmatimonadales bacterium]
MTARAPWWQWPSVLALGTLVLVGGIPMPADGQTRGATVAVPYTLPFSTSGQSMWGPGNAPANIDITFTLFDESWLEQGTASSIVNAIGTQWGGSISGRTSGAVGLSFRIFDVGSGGVALNYPVRVILDVPEPNSFRDGEEVTIGSRLELLPGWSLTTAPPGGTMAITGKFGTALRATGKVCFFGCSNDLTLIDVGIPTDPFELFRVGSQGGISFQTLNTPLLPNPLVIQTLPYEFGSLLDPFGDILGLEGPVDAPRVQTTASPAADGRSLVANGRHQFVDLKVDLDQYLTLVGVPPLGFQTNEALDLVAGASFGYDVADLSLLLDVFQRQTFTFVPRVTITVAFPRSVRFTVVNSDGTPVDEGEGTSVRFDVGQSLRVAFPSASKDPLPGTPTYELDNTFRSQTGFEFDETLVMSAGAFNLHTPSKSVTENTTTTVCSLGWLSAIKEICEFFGGILQTITNTVTATVQAVNVDLGPLAQQTLVDDMQTVPLFPSSGQSGEWTLQGLPTFTEAPFALDPEDPRIAVATNLASAVLATGGPAGALLQTVRVRNEGDVALSAAQLRDALAASITGGSFHILGVTSPTLTPAADPAFDGEASPALLGGGDVLGVNEEGVVTILMAVTPGNVYRAHVRGDGVSPIGTAVVDETVDALGVVAFEIIPDQVSAWSNGVLPTRIRTQGIDAAQVDPATVVLEGVRPTQWNFTSSGDLILKFPLQDVLSALEARLVSQAPIAAAIVAEPADATAMRSITVADVAAAVMGETERLTAAGAAAVDRGGNGNGTLDLGNLRALVMANRRPADAGAVPDGPQASGAAGDSQVLVLTGALLDGTRLVGEDDLSVLNGGD